MRSSDVSKASALGSRPESLQFIPMDLGRRRSTFPTKEELTVGMLYLDRQKIGGIAFCAILQCIAAIVLSVSVLRCLWSPDKFESQNMKIIMVMYLYDYKQCGFKVGSSKSIQTVELHQRYNTTGMSVKPVIWHSIVKSTSTRLTETTRKYLEISIGFHGLWMFIALMTWIFSRIRRLNYKHLRRIITGFMYAIVLMVIFDVSMAIVYVAHIQQSLTKSMILRYAGWANELKVNNPEDFGGWIPMIASVCWMRGVIFLIFNIFSVRTIWFIRKKIKKKQVIVKHAHKKNMPIPESMLAVNLYETKENALVFHP